MKYCTVAKSVGRGWPILNVRRRPRARRLRSAAGSINSGRHIPDFTMRRALHKRRVFDFVPSYLNLTSHCVTALWHKTKSPMKYGHSNLSYHPILCNSKPVFWVQNHYQWNKDTGLSRDLRALQLFTKTIFAIPGQPSGCKLWDAIVMQAIWT